MGSSVSAVGRRFITLESADTSGTSKSGKESRDVWKKRPLSRGWPSCCAKSKASRSWLITHGRTAERCFFPCAGDARGQTRRFSPERHSLGVSATPGLRAGCRSGRLLQRELLFCWLFRFQSYSSQVIRGFLPASKASFSSIEKRAAYSSMSPPTCSKSPPYQR